RAEACAPNGQREPGEPRTSKQPPSTAAQPKARPPAEPPPAHPHNPKPKPGRHDRLLGRRGADADESDALAVGPPGVYHRCMHHPAHTDLTGMPDPRNHAGFRTATRVGMGREGFE